MTPNELLNLRHPLILASASPRRKSLMEHVGYVFTVVAPSVDESAVPTSLPPAQYVEELALIKARDRAGTLQHSAYVIGSDTTVVLNGRVLNKPEGPEEAATMLMALSGQTHHVFTGVAIVYCDGNGKQESRVVHKRTSVAFRVLTPNEIETYVASGSPLDKAGAYGIQDDFGAVFVTHIEGCYYTIVGLPMELLYSTLREFAKEINNA